MLYVGPNYSVTAFIVAEQLGISYSNWLVEVPDHSARSLDCPDGGMVPVQATPRLAIDQPGDGKILFANLDVQPHSVEVYPHSSEECVAERVKHIVDTDGDVIENGAFSIRLPRPGDYRGDVPGPVAGYRVNDGKWLGRCRLVGLDLEEVKVSVHIDSIGPALGQWTISYRWGISSGADFCVRWAKGADTIVVQEDILHDSLAAYEFFPTAPYPSAAFHKGAGERLGPLVPWTPQLSPHADQLSSRTVLGHLGHISYFNQWTDSWVGFGSDQAIEYVGAFGGWSSKWRRRGHVRPEVFEDVDEGAGLRLPLKEGRRIWGLVLTDRDSVDPLPEKRRHIINQRKNQYADIPLAKQMDWLFDYENENQDTHLFNKTELHEFRERLAMDPEVTIALEKFLTEADAEHACFTAAAIWKNDPDLVRKSVPVLLRFAKWLVDSAADGGYDRVCIFHGREAKRKAYEVEALWALGLLTPVEYHAIRKGLLVLAYIFADPDYCRYEDFWAEQDRPSEGVFEVMKNEMGDSPVPPNFAAEFFSTTAVVAELFDLHPERENWRKFGDELAERFLNRWFEPDGTYLESINYHKHCFSELMCQLYPAINSGRIDYLSNPRIKGSLEHFLDVRTPVIGANLPHDERKWLILASPDLTRRSMLPADGNSGEDGDEQEWGEQLGISAALYKIIDPQLSGQLAAAWRESGKVILGAEHPLLTLLTTDPSISSTPRRLKSVHRRSLGIVSHANLGDGSPVWSLFRAGHATHHMDFDQGNLHVAARGRIVLGDHGYHTYDEAGRHFGGAATYLHNLISYSKDPDNSSGYTGLEVAPAPAFVHLSDNFDYVVHTIRNTNFRRLNELPYNVTVPTAETVHTRHYLFVKPSCIVLWDTFQRCPEATVFRLHPTTAVRQLDQSTFVTGELDAPDLQIKFVLPELPVVTENRQYGPLWSFAVTQDAGAQYLTVLELDPSSGPLHTEYLPSNRRLTIESARGFLTVDLPEEGAAQLPVLL